MTASTVRNMIDFDKKNNRVSIYFNRQLYKPEAIFQAACSFFDRAMVFVDLIGDDIVVSFEFFDKRRSLKKISREFCEAVYAYCAYMDREERTKDIREELIAGITGDGVR